jgi:D-threo-aldose 1-dehydrogenase
MRFASSHPAVSSVVLGSVTPQEVARNVAAFAAPIPPQLWRDLVNERLVRDDAPLPA